MRFLGCGLALTIALGAVALAHANDVRLPLFHGEWALNGEHCGKGYGRGVAEDQFIEIGRGSFRMYESVCRITQVRKLSQTDWSTVLDCQSEGEVVTQGWSIKKHSPYRFTVLNGAGGGREYRLCR
ncbi:MAG: hypothetical protein AAFY99_03600 [Pseudomonadota bacterium]